LISFSQACSVVHGCKSSINVFLSYFFEGKASLASVMKSLKAEYTNGQAVLPFLLFKKNQQKNPNKPPQFWYNFSKSNHC